MNSTELNVVFDCQMWDSVTGEWERVTVDVPERAGDTTEPVAEQAQAINEAISIQLDEDPRAWVLTDSHTMQASGEEVLMIQLRALASDDISVIMAVRVPN